jgi:hypothetical protein
MRKLLCIYLAILLNIVGISFIVTAIYEFGIMTGEIFSAYSLYLPSLTLITGIAFLIAGAFTIKYILDGKL